MGYIPQSMLGLRDSFGRRFSYLRLSLTDACNFKCTYCLPHGYRKPEGVPENYLSLNEIHHLVTAFAELGTVKVRLTGGEPTLRSDLFEIADRIYKIPGIQTLALSTNGFRLKQFARRLLEVGVTRLNVSIDSLNSEKFREITGQDRLGEILNGIDFALKAGFQSVKVNAVLLKDWNEDEFELFQEWIRRKPITVRWIELMPTGQNTSFFKERHVQADQLRKKLVENGWSVRARGEADGPAVEFTHPDYMGRMGLIAPYSKDFCSTCNRLRVSSYGGLRLCLFGEGNHSVRHLLQRESQKEELKAHIVSLLQRKEVSHYLPEGKVGNNRTFSAMGG